MPEHLHAEIAASRRTTCRRRNGCSSPPTINRWPPRFDTWKRSAHPPRNEARPAPTWKTRRPCSVCRRKAIWKGRICSDRRSRRAPRLSPTAWSRAVVAGATPLVSARNSRSPHLEARLRRDDRWNGINNHATASAMSPCAPPSILVDAQRVLVVRVGRAQIRLHPERNLRPRGRGTRHRSGPHRRPGPRRRRGSHSPQAT